MSGQWIERPKPPHRCEKPDDSNRYTMDWKCECGVVWRWVIHWDQREGEYSGWEKV